MSKEIAGVWPNGCNYGDECVWTNYEEYVCVSLFQYVMCRFVYREIIPKVLDFALFCIARHKATELVPLCQSFLTVLTKKLDTEVVRNFVC